MRSNLYCVIIVCIQADTVLDYRLCQFLIDKLQDYYLVLKVLGRGVFDIHPLPNSLSIVLVLFFLLVSSSLLLVASIVLSILSHLRSSHVPNPWYRYHLHLGFQQS